MSPIGADDAKVPFPSTRLASLPDIYLMKHHPKNPGTGRSYYYVQDSSTEGMSRVFDLEHGPNCIKPPTGPEIEAITQGFLRLDPNDMIFVRLDTSPSSGEKDVPVVWTNGLCRFPDSLRDKTLAIRDRILGPRHLRTRHQPTRLAGGALTGGTAFERTSPKGIRNGRCYSFGLSHEEANIVTAPCASGKLKDNDPFALALRSDLIQSGYL
ncbi:hypothetical protein BDZ97DRAFT_1772095 [Flammula alnicola]|nr:hypothetical protein BDZ97DRAFT_1772095 [Flammula alnicola]